MDGNSNNNLNHQYMMNFGHQQPQTTPRFQQQDYANLLFNQQSYINNLNMPVIYNSGQQQPVDVQALQRQQQILQALNNPQSQVQQQQLIDQNLTQQNSVSQQLQQQIYASSVQFQQRQQVHPQTSEVSQSQHQQLHSGGTMATTPSLSELGHLAMLQNGGNLFQQSQHQQLQQQLHLQQPQQHNIVQQQQQHPQFRQKDAIDYVVTNTPSTGPVPSAAQSHLQHPATSNVANQHRSQQQQNSQSFQANQQQLQQQYSTSSQISAIMQQQQQLLQQQKQHVVQQPIPLKLTTTIHPTTPLGNCSPATSSSSTNNARAINVVEQVVQSQYGLPSARRSKEDKQSYNTNLENARLLKEREEEILAEKRKQEEREKQRIQDELRRKKEEAKEFADSLNERARSFPEPIYLANCHTLSKVSSFIPFPSECASTSASLSCFDEQRVASVLTNDNVDLTNFLSDILADATEDIREIELKHEEDESNDLESEFLTPLVQSILNFNSSALNVESSDLGLNEIELEQAFGKDIQEAVKQVALETDADAMAAATASFFNDRGSSEGDVYQAEDSFHVTSAAADSSISSEAQKKQQEAAAAAGHDQVHLRRQMVSVGKQPKAATTRKKRDMVESLYDSLTGYFDPSKNRRCRTGRGSSSNNIAAKSSEDEEVSSVHRETSVERYEAGGMDLTATINAVAANDRNDDLKASSSRETIEEPTIGKFYDRRAGFGSNIKKRQRHSENDDNRPPTPTEIIEKREMEWFARQQLRMEKHRRRQNEVEDWNNDVMAANESVSRFTNLIDQVLEQIDDFDIVQNEASVEIAQELLIDRNIIEELRKEAQKLKSWRKMHDVAVDRLVKLLTVLEKNIRDVLNEDGSLLAAVTAECEDETDEAYREIMDERLLRSVDAACVALTIMTSTKMARQVLLEDAIERAIQLCKQYLQYIIYPATDASFRSPAKMKKNQDGVKRRRVLDSFSPTKVMIYSRIVDIILCFSELARFQPLNDSLMVQLSSLSIPPFFVDNVPEIQVESIKLLSTIFSKAQFLRQSILIDLQNSLYRLSTSRSSKNCYHLGNGEYVSNFTVLVLQLIQSTVKLPQHGKRGNYETEENHLDAEIDDRIVLDSYEEAKRRAVFFLERFLAKCTAKSEDDYRRLFEQFLNDILLLLYRPEWPVAEMVLMVLANLLVLYFRSRNSSTMPSLRVASLEYLGTITSRLRRDRVIAESLAASQFEQNRLDLVVRGIVYDEMNDMTKTVDEIDISHLSSNEKLRKLEQALVDYLIYTRGDSDPSVEYIVTFYAAEWYRGTVLDVDLFKAKYEELAKQKTLSQREAVKQEKKLEKIIEKGANMKEFIVMLLDKKHLKKRAQYMAKTANVMIDSDAQWVVKYLASKKEDLSQAFDVYLKHILEGFNPDFPVAVRAKAMKCLTQVVEVDPQVLMNPDVDLIVRDRLVDANAAVREAAFELIGKYLVIKPELLNSFYTILTNRIKDTAVAVRKRVIRILREIVDKQPQLDKKPEILARIVQRINDEEGVKKLCLETFQYFWFIPNRDHEKELLKQKVISMADVVDVCVKEGIIEHFETLIATLVKKSNEQDILVSSRQIVDALVDYIISLDSKIANEEQKIDDVEKLEQTQLEMEKANQARLLASLTTLSVFAKARATLLVRHADVFLPYLSMSVSSNTELRVLNQMIQMLEQIVPLMEHPSDTFLRALDGRLNDVVRDGGMVIIASAIACMSAAYEKFMKVFPGICNLFIVYLKYLMKLKQDIEDNSFELSSEKRPHVMRSLYTLGLAGRYFDFDKLLWNQPEYEQRLTFFGKRPAMQSAAATPSSDGGNSNSGFEERQLKESTHILRDQIFAVLLFFSRNRDYNISEKALIALGQLTAGCPDLLIRSEIKNMYSLLLGTEVPAYMKLKIQVLRNLSCFLNAEEVRALKKNEEYMKARAEDKDDLKEMELSASGLSSSVIQVYWNAILKCYFHTDVLVRSESAQVIWQTLEQGLVTPGSSIPTLIAMSTDPIAAVRVRISNLIKETDAKYAGMVASKAIPGIRMAFQLHKKINNSGANNAAATNQESSKKPGKEQSTDNSSNSSSANSFSIRGVRPITIDHLTNLTLSNDVQSLLIGLYTGIRTNRQQRRSFLSAVLRLFSENVREPPELSELSFVADNLAHFPYQVMDEPLYVIYQADSIISISGQNVLSNFKQLLNIGTTSSANSSQQSQDGGHQQAVVVGGGVEADDDDDNFSEERLMSRFPADLTKVYELREQSLPCFFLLHLKFYLMRMYGFSKEKIQEYSPSEAAKVYEKPMNRRNIAVFSPEALMRHLDDGVVAQPSSSGHGQKSVSPPPQSADSQKARRKLAEHFRGLFQMLLSLDKEEDDDEAEELRNAPTTTTVVDPEGNHADGDEEGDNVEESSNNNEENIRSTVGGGDGSRKRRRITDDIDENSNSSSALVGKN